MSTERLDRSVALVAVGASAGGVETLCRLVRGLPNDLPATVIVVLHIAPYASSALPEILKRCGPLPAAHARDGDELVPGRILVAPPDHHVVVDSGRIGLSRGPKENGVRPAIDVLFRTAADELGRGVIAVVLSGTLDDGTAGLRYVKEQGGIAVVQDPEDALFRSMPESAVRYAEPHYIAPLAGLTDLLIKLVDGTIEDERDEEVAVASPTPNDDQDLDASAAAQEGEITELRCPDCGGTLWETTGDFPRYRCRVGHSFSPETLVSEQTAALEESLWAAVVALEERADLADRMARRADAGHRHRRASGYRRDAADARGRADLIRSVIPPSNSQASEELAGTPDNGPRNE